MVAASFSLKEKYACYLMHPHLWNDPVICALKKTVDGKTVDGIVFSKVHNGMTLLLLRVWEINIHYYNKANPIDVVQHEYKSVWEIVDDGWEVV